MFGKKQGIILGLRSDLNYIRDRGDVYYNNWTKAADELARKTSELEIVQESYRKQLDELHDLKAQVGGLKEEVQKADAYADERIGAIEYELNEARTQLDNLREEATESSRMLELYKALVASLRIVINLPAGKK